MMKLQKKPTVEDSELYYNPYPHYELAHTVYACLNLETGELSTYFDRNMVGSGGTRVFHDLDVIWEIPALTVAGVEFLFGVIAEACQKFLYKTSVGWDGSNHRGYVSEEARELHHDIEMLINHYEFDGMIYTPEEDED